MQNVLPSNYKPFLQKLQVVLRIFNDLFKFEGVSEWTNGKKYGML
jgi:hypothetical protein